MKIAKDITYLEIAMHFIAYTSFAIIFLFVVLIFIGQVVPLDKDKAINKTIDIPFSENK